MNPSGQCPANPVTGVLANAVAERALMVEYAWLSSTVPPAGITMPLLGATDRILPAAGDAGVTLFRVSRGEHEHVMSRDTSCGCRTSKSTMSCKTLNSGP